MAASATFRTYWLALLARTAKAKMAGSFFGARPDSLISTIMLTVAIGVLLSTFQQRLGVLGSQIPLADVIRATFGPENQESLQTAPAVQDIAVTASIILFLSLAGNRSALRSNAGRNVFGKILHGLTSRKVWARLCQWVFLMPDNPLTSAQSVLPGKDCRSVFDIKDVITNRLRPGGTLVGLEPTT